MSVSFLGSHVPSSVALCALLCAGTISCTDDSNPDDGAGGGGQASGAGAAGGAGGSSAEGAGGGAGTSTKYAALVRGTLFTDDMAAAKAKHDAIASGGEEQAKSLGDIGHDALLGTTMLGTTENQYLALDRWAEDNMSKIYDDPGFQQAFGQLFAMPPSLELFEARPTWATWGDLGSGDDYEPHWFVVVRGHLKESDPSKAQAAHDGVAEPGKAPALAAGDVAHVPFVGMDDAQEYLAIDIWKDSTNLEVFYSNPDLQKAFSSVFDAPPSVGVYESTDWHQW